MKFPSFAMSMTKNNIHKHNKNKLIENADKKTNSSEHNSFYSKCYSPLKATKTHFTQTWYKE